jgi:hypothetical protein
MFLQQLPLVTFTAHAQRQEVVIRMTGTVVILAILTKTPLASIVAWKITALDSAKRTELIAELWYPFPMKPELCAEKVTVSAKNPGTL